MRPKVKERIVQVVLDTRSLGRNSFALSLFIALLLVPSLLKSETTTPSCAQFSEAEVRELLNVSIYSEGKFDMRICEERGPLDVIYNLKVEFRDSLLSNGATPISRFERVTELEGCEAARAAYHIWAFYLFNVKNDISHPDLEPLSRYISFDGLSCFQFVSGLISLKILHVVLNPDHYSEEVDSFASGERAAETWVGMINAGEQDATINFRILRALHNGDGISLSAANVENSVNVLVLNAVAAMCRGETSDEYYEGLAIPILEKTISLRHQAPDQFENLCASGTFPEGTFEYQSEW